MKWFRSNIKYGSRLALFALAIQFVAAFGHWHGVAAKAAPTLQASVEQSRSFADTAGSIRPDQDLTAKPAPQPDSNHDTDQQSGDACAICAVIALANTVLFSTPPLLLLPDAVEFLHQTTDAEFIHLTNFRIAFQPRAPPAS
jgi:Protein of unknown function (DUF2946)